jgi:uncharacterized membrane protein YdbT with pleckstrin-like domain
MSEKTLWTGTPSQLLNLPVFILCFIFFWLVIPIFIAFWKWLVIRTTEYELTTERLKHRYGVLNKNMDDLELYRVRDYKLEQPFWQRIFGLGTITMQTSDRSHPIMRLRAIRGADRLREQIRSAVEACKQQKGVRELDVE